MAVIAQAVKLSAAREIYSKLEELQILDTNYDAISKLKKVLVDYVSTEHPAGRPIRGTIDFPEANRVISYKLPTKEGDGVPRVMMEHRYFKS